MTARDEVASGLSQLEGYLLWNAEQERAHRMAAAFTERLPWLTDGQRAEVERVYTADRLAVSRAVLTHVAGRAEELRAEYTARYRQLRLRCYAAALMLATALTCTSVVTTLLASGD